MITPPLLRLTATPVLFGGVPVPWTGTLTNSGLLATPTEVRVQGRLNQPGSWSASALFAPQDTGLEPWTAHLGASVDRTLLREGSLVRLGVTWDASDFADAGSPGAVSSLDPITFGMVEGVDVTWTGDRPLVTYSGRTHLALLEKVRVYPFGGLERQPFAEQRVFGWQSPEFDDLGWSLAQVMATQATGSVAWTLDSGSVAPQGWPNDLSAAWIWHDNPGGSPSSSTNADVGTCLFRRKWVGAAAGRYALFITADNLFAAYVDGVEVAANRQNSYGWQSTTRFDFDLTAGDHVIAVRAENIGGLSLNPAGVLATIRLVNPDGTLTAVSDTVGPLHTDGHWRCLPYVTPPYPGFTAGQVLRILVAEALARDTTNVGPLQSLVFPFTDTNDSAGGLWTVLPELSLPVGSSLIDTLRTMHDVAGTVFTDVNSNPALTAAAALAVWVYNDWPAEVDVHTYGVGTELVGFNYRLGTTA